MGFVKDVGEAITGKTGADAAKSGSKAQVAQSEAAIEFARESLRTVRGDLAPFREAGAGAIPLLTGAIDDPSSRVLQNPFFQALASDQEQRLLASQAARGKVGAGETGDQLTRNLLLLGNQFAQQDVGNLFNLATLGANAAAQTGTATQQTSGQVGNLLTGIGNAQAAGLVGAANSQQQALTNIFGQGAGLGAALAFSDIRLKENIRFTHAENGINMYVWDWKEEHKSLVGSQDNSGPIAQELRKTHPDLVITDPETGFLKVLM